ncbi:MAG: acyl-CoA dehydrogenase family protein, partial [Alphaproteobacteria bacterium]
MLPEEIEEFRRMLRRFVDRELIPLERDGPVEGAAKKALQEKAKSAGLWLLDVPEQYGGQGLGLLAMSIFWHEISRTVSVP